MSVDPVVLCKYYQTSILNDGAYRRDSYHPILAASFPHGRKLHYWAKSTLFGHPVAKAILLNAGNVPVYRKAKDNQALYKGTFDVLAVGEVVAIFPEGESPLSILYFCLMTDGYNIAVPLRNELYGTAHHAGERWRFMECTGVLQVAANS